MTSALAIAFCGEAHRKQWPQNKLCQIYCGRQFKSCSFTDGCKFVIDEKVVSPLLNMHHPQERPRETGGRFLLGFRLWSWWQW
jgi:hypothetical protein